MLWRPSSPKKRQGKHFNDPMLGTRSDEIFLFLSVFFPSFIFSCGCREYSNCSVKVVHCRVWGGERLSQALFELSIFTVDE
jgi:hypothetical protein